MPTGTTSTQRAGNAEWTTPQRFWAARWWAATAAGTNASTDLQVATRRRIFRRNSDNTVNLNQPSITLDIGNVELCYANKGGRL
jgi:hypothetical protein